MIEFNKNNKIEKVSFQAKLKEEKIVEPVKDFLTEMINRATNEMHGTGTFKGFEILTQNQNQYQDVAEYGLRLRPASTSINSKESILEFATKSKDNGGKSSMYLPYVKGTRDEILAKLKDPKLLEDLNDFVKESSRNFFSKD